jgi:hypothetical protein
VLLHSGLFSDAPPTLGQAGFAARANGRKWFAPVSYTIGNQRDSSKNIHLNFNSIHSASSWIDVEWSPDFIGVMVSSARDNPA